MDYLCSENAWKLCRLITRTNVLWTRQCSQGKILPNKTLLKKRPNHNLTIILFTIGFVSESFFFIIMLLEEASFCPVSQWVSNNNGDWGKTALADHHSWPDHDRRRGRRNRQIDHWDTRKARLPMSQRHTYIRVSQRHGHPWQCHGDISQRYGHLPQCHKDMQNLK